MKLKAKHLLYFCVATLTCSAALPGQARAIYLASRNDGRGSGSPTDPYDGASADRYDAILARYPASTDFHYAAGVYQSHGYYYQHENIHAGCRHFGAGVDKTVIRLVAPNHGSAASGLLFGADYNQSADGFEMHNLTLDCNATHNPVFEKGLGAVGAVNIQGNNLLFQNMKIVGFGTGKQGTECFAFFSYPGEYWKGKTFQNIKLDHVTFTAAARGNRDGTTVTTVYASEGVNVQNTQIVNCEFLDLDAEFTYVHALGALYNENNLVRNCTEGGYFETADHQDRTFVFKNNTYQNVRKAVYINCHPNASIGKIIFDNNKVSLRPDIPNNAAVGLNDAGIQPGQTPDRIGSIEFENNTVYLASYGEFSSLCRALSLQSAGRHYSIGQVVASGNKVSGLPTGQPYYIQADLVGKLSIH